MTSHPLIKNLKTVYHKTGKNAIFSASVFIFLRQKTAAFIV